MIDRNSPAYWHLSTRSSKKNKVECFIDGQSYMSKLYEVINETGITEGDFIFVTGWLFSLNQCLRGQQDSSSNFINLLISRATQTINPVLVKILPWMPTGIAEYIIKDNAKQHTALMLKCYEVNNPKFQVCLSAQNLGGGSHHQKFIIIKKNNEYFAFLGGIDIASDRWDTNNHNNDGSNRNHKDFFGWHDIHTLIQGPAVTEIFNNFKERWNAMRGSDNFLEVSKSEVANMMNIIFNSGIYLDMTKLNANLSDESDKYFIHFTSPNYSEIENDISISEPSDGFYTQALRTIGKNSTPGINWDYSVMIGFKQAIEKAENYIYIEDQYFWYSRSLIESFKIAARKGVRIIVVTVKQSDASNEGDFWVNQRIAHHRAWMTNFELINLASISVGKGKCCFIYHLDPSDFGEDEVERLSYDNRENYYRFRQIYVHSKLMIIDDIFVSIGSANLNDRSMTTDTEIAITIVNESFAQSLRKDIWNHLLSPYGSPERYEAPNTWPYLDIYSSPVHVVALHNLKVDEENNQLEYFELLADGKVDERFGGGYTFTKILNPYNK
ncbi:MAG: phospholipase D-like domain-containing protein [Ignavibacteria bacterium]